MSAIESDLRRVAGAIPDPEMPALTIADLGILRDVRVDRSGHVDVDITPTYSGCPALDTIREDVERCVVGNDAVERATPNGTQQGEGFNQVVSRRRKYATLRRP